jgi:putative oxidoreductase
MHSILNGMLAIRRLVLTVAGLLEWAPPTLARLTVGWIVLWSGWGKLYNPESVTQFFAELGIPYPELQAPFASGTELACGVLLLIGLFTRVASVPLIIVMIVAIWTAQRENVTALGDLFGLSEYLYITLLIWLGVSGPGPLSLDAALVRLVASRDGRAPRTGTMPVGRYERVARA